MREVALDRRRRGRPRRGGPRRPRGRPRPRSGPCSRPRRPPRGSRRSSTQPVPGSAPAEQDTGRQRGDPVGHLEAGDPRSAPGPARSAPDLVVPPQVVRVDAPPRPPPAGYGAARSSAWPSVDTTQRSAANIGCSGSIANRTPAAAACGTSSPIASPTVRAGRVQVPAAVGQAAADEHEHRRAQHRRLVDGPAVVVEPAGRGEEPAPAQGRHAQAGVADQGGGAFEAERSTWSRHSPSCETPAA